MQLIGITLKQIFRSFASQLNSELKRNEITFLLSGDLHPTKCICVGECKPLGTPPGIQIVLKSIQHWDGERKSGHLWVAEPQTPEDIVKLANWAYQEGYKLRAIGSKHSWAPLSITDNPNCHKTLLLNMKKHLTSISIQSLETVSVETGTKWEELLSFLESKGHGIFGYPEVGNVTIGGTMAVGSHGTGISLKASPTGLKDGSVSDLVTELDAVVWDPQKYIFVLRTFTRKEKDTKAFLVHLGRAIVTRVSMTIGHNFNLRCVSLTNIRGDTVYGPDSSDPFSMSSLVLKHGRVDAQLYPYTDHTLIRIWSEAKEKGKESLEISASYPFTDPSSKQFDKHLENLSLIFPQKTVEA